MCPIYTLRTATLGAIVLLCLPCIRALEYLIRSKALRKRGPLASHLRPRQNDPPVFALTLPAKTRGSFSQVVIRDPQITHTETNGVQTEITPQLEVWILIQLLDLSPLAAMSPG